MKGKQFHWKLGHHLPNLVQWDSECLLYNFYNGCNKSKQSTRKVLKLLLFTGFYNVYCTFYCKMVTYGMEGDIATTLNINCTINILYIDYLGEKSVSCQIGDHMFSNHITKCVIGCNSFITYSPGW